MREFLKGLDLEKDLIDTIMAEHGKLVTGYKEALESSKAKSAQDTAHALNQISELETKLKAYNGVDVDALRGELETLKEDKEKLVAEHTEALTAAQMDALLRECIAGEKFSSEYAKRGVYDEIKAAVKFEDGKLTGYDEAIAAIREKQPAAFCTEAETHAPPKDAGKPHRGGGETTLSMEQIRKMTPEQINDNWDAVSASMKNQKG